MDPRLTRRQGDGGLARIRNDLDDLFGRFFGDWGWGPGTSGGRGGWNPRLDIAESADDVTIRAELPGVDPENIEIDVKDDRLTIRGEKQYEHEDKQRDYQCVECEVGSFFRSVELPSGVDPESVDAAYRDGVLTITAQKRPEQAGRRIKVRKV